MTYNTIGFIGLGLIGGSIAKTIKRVFPDIKLFATSGRESTVKEAFDAGVIENEKPISLRELGSMDLLFLCAPVQLNNEYLSMLKTVISPNCLITDVGSVKGDIHEKVIIHGLEEHFIGGHPMAGSEKTGFANATPHLLENAYYILTPTEKVAPEKVEAFKSFVETLGSIPLVMDCEKHDRSTAAISHLPHVVATTLVNFVKDSDYEDETMKTIAAGGFKDITRIASSSPVMWEDICLANKDEIVRSLDIFTQKLDSIKEAIKKSEGSKVNELFAEAGEYRNSINVTKKNVAKDVFELYIDLIDKKGAIAEVATLLAENNFDIKNIGIINNREFIDGVLRLELRDRNSIDAAIELLKKNNYTIYER